MFNIDDLSRECVAQVADFSISGLRLTHEFDRLCAPHTEYCPDLNWVASNADARAIIDTRRKHYNHVRPHRSLGTRPTAVFAKEAA